MKRTPEYEEGYKHGYTQCAADISREIRDQSKRAEGTPHHPAYRWLITVLRDVRRKIAS